MALTNREVYINSLSYIKEYNLKTPKSVVNELLIYVNGYKNYTELILNLDKEISNSDVFMHSFKEICDGKPYQYVLKQAYFVNFNLYVDENVLIPRVETEGLVTIVRKLIDENNILKDTIFDCCSGSGCISLFFKKCYPTSKVYGTDISKKAIEISKKNAKDLGLDVTYIESNKLDYFLKNNMKCDVFLSNPPYVSNKNDIEESVKKYEPEIAVYIENNDEFYEEYFKNYKNIMNEKFLMAFEINYDQKESLTNLIGKYFKEENTSFVFLKDIYNKDRYLIILGGYDVNYFSMRN